MFSPDLIRLLVFDYVAPQCFQTALNCSMLNVKWRRVLEADKLEFMQRVISTNRWHAFCQTFFQCPQCSAVIKHKNALRHEKRHRTSDVFHYQVCKLCVKVHVGLRHNCDLRAIPSCLDERQPHLQLYCDKVCLKNRCERYWSDLDDQVGLKRQEQYFWFGLSFVAAVLISRMFT